MFFRQSTKLESVFEEEVIKNHFIMKYDLYDLQQWNDFRRAFPENEKRNEALAFYLGWNIVKSKLFYFDGREEEFFKLYAKEVAEIGVNSGYFHCYKELLRCWQRIQREK